MLLADYYAMTDKNMINPLTPRGDQHETSPYSILILSSKQVMRKFQHIS